MNKSFRILGLSEKATKEQVKAAYEEKSARYKGSDYAEDPKYVKKKLRELQNAYEEAYGLAENDSVSVVHEDIQKEGFVSERRLALEREDNGMLALLMLMIAVSLFAVTIAVLSCDSATVNPHDFNYVYDYAVEEVADRDAEVEQIARGIKNVFFEQEQHVGILLEDEEEHQTLPLLSIAEKFAKVYWQEDSLAAVSDYLSSQYSQYNVDSSNTTVAQLDAIMLFYGFPTADETLYGENPYTGEPILNYSDHLAFLIDGYYELEDTIKETE